MSIPSLSNGSSSTQFNRPSSKESARNQIGDTVKSGLSEILLGPEDTSLVDAKSVNSLPQDDAYAIDSSSDFPEYSDQALTKLRSDLDKALPKYIQKALNRYNAA